MLSSKDSVFDSSKEVENEDPIVTPKLASTKVVLAVTERETSTESSRVRVTVEVSEVAAVVENSISELWEELVSKFSRISIALGSWKDMSVSSGAANGLYARSYSSARYSLFVSK